MNKSKMGIMVLALLLLSAATASATVTSNVTFQDTGLSQTSNTTDMKQLVVIVNDTINDSKVIRINLPSLLTFNDIVAVSYNDVNGTTHNYSIISSNSTLVQINLNSTALSSTSINVTLNVSTDISGTDDVQITVLSPLPSVNTILKSITVYEYPVIIKHFGSLIAEASNTSSYIELMVDGTPSSTYNLTGPESFAFYSDAGGTPDLGNQISSVSNGVHFFVLSVSPMTTDITATSQTDSLDNDSISVTFTPSPTPYSGSITGIVKDTYGNGLYNITVELYAIISGSRVEIAETTTVNNPNGSYVFTSLNPGEYWVEAEVTNYVGIAAGPIIVESDYTTTGGSDIVLIPVFTPTTIDVTVVSPGQKLVTIPADGIATVQVRVNVKDQYGDNLQGAIVNLDLAPGLGVLNSNTVTTGSDGMAYAVVTSTFNSLGTDTIKGTLVSGTNDEATIRYIATKGNASIAGIVLDKEGNPIPFAKVWISPIGGNQTYEYAAETANWTTDVTLTNEHGQYALYDVYAATENTDDLLSGNNYSFYNLSAYLVDTSIPAFYNKTVLENRVIEDNVTNTYNIILDSMPTKFDYTIDLDAHPEWGVAGGNPVSLTAEVDSTEYIIVDSIRYNISKTPVTGVSVHFTTDFGTLADSNSMTDSNGSAITTISSEDPGIASINASYMNVFHTETVEFSGIGHISGDITNENNSQLIGASVDLRILKNGLYVLAHDVYGEEIRTITDTPDGHYAYANVPTGHYKVIATYGNLTGFAYAIVESGTVTADVVIAGAVVEPDVVTLDSIAVEGDTTVVSGLTATYTARATYSDGTNPIISASWASSNATVATIDAGTGVLTARAVGTTIVTATSSGVTSDVMIVTVIDGGLSQTGDINGNGAVQLSDAIYLAKHVAGTSGYETLFADGDINGNGAVQLSDAIYLAKHVAGTSGYDILY